MLVVIPYKYTQLSAMIFLSQKKAYHRPNGRRSGGTMRLSSLQQVVVLLVLVAPSLWTPNCGLAAATNLSSDQNAMLLEKEKNIVGEVVPLPTVVRSRAAVDPLGNLMMDTLLSSSTAEDSEDKRELQTTKMPKSAPPNCEDEPDWKVAGYNDESMASFKDKTCNDLEVFVVGGDESQVETWCNYHRIHTGIGKSAAEACCFCGGGKHVPTPCEDFSDWSLVSSGSDDLIGCDFIANLPNSKANWFCNTIKDHPGAGGYTAKDACCVCNGGFRPLFGVDDSSENIPSSRRKLVHDEGDETPTNVNVNYNHEYREYMNRIGLGESEGIPNLEYLGLGYDGLRGNPRGSSSSELDPGTDRF